jgi:hypothetical protein
MTVSAITSVVFLYDSFTKNKKNFWFYLRFFIINLIILILVKFSVAKAYAQEISSNNLEKSMMLSFISPLNSLSEDQMATLKNKMEFHNKECRKCYKKASDLARWYLPTLDEEQNAQYCWETAGVVIGGYTSGATPMTIALAMILAASAQYLKDCSQQWHEMRRALYEAEGHADMAMFYAEMIANEINKRRRGY